MTVEPRLADLPTWNLADLYPGPDSAELKRDLDRAAKEARQLAEAYRGNIAASDGARLAEALAIYEKLEDRLGRVMSYAQLLHAGDMTDPEIGKFYQSMQERATEIAADTLFLRLEINRLDDAAMAEKLKAPALKRFEPWLRDLRVFRPHELSDEMEKLLLEKSIAGRSAWIRLFDETAAALRFKVRDRDLNMEEALHLLSERDRELRRDAAKSIGATLSGNIRLFGLVLNTIMKDKEIEDRWRKYPSPPASRHLANQVEPEVVAALEESVARAFPKIAHRYYKLKAGWLGLDKLEFWDRNAPLPDTDDSFVGWDEARGVVLDAYQAFSPELGRIGTDFFDKRWIDAPSRPGKASGAFAHPTVPSAHPYLLLNYQGKTRDVMTLAHELGHGVHQVLAAVQGPLMADTPLTLAETASVFGEQLTFRALLKRQTDPKRRRALLASKVEDMINTVVRQIAFYRFEQRLHAERKQAELTPEQIGKIWMEIQTESLGPAFHFDEEYKSFWAYISHFVHAPFYVYAYAFGDCLVNALYAVYLERPEGFEAKYIEMLKAGGTLRHKELLAPFGLDASDPAFWSKGLDVISGFIDELEK
ncbi:M3 family oligoendopeptidase [Desertibaculum subflavum]|uniref:M3 family oligoendopeptidase n=1 Tax=Desertibaculum subflavum TaxID=2268458 RepID=UPI000E66EB3F